MGGTVGQRSKKAWPRRHGEERHASRHLATVVPAIYGTMGHAALALAPSAGRRSSQCKTAANKNETTAIYFCSIFWRTDQYFPPFYTATY